MTNKQIWTCKIIVCHRNLLKRKGIKEILKQALHGGSAGLKMPIHAHVLTGDFDP